MSVSDDIFDVIVVGGGHAGCEAYAAACRVGAGKVALVTPRLAEVALQPCNPAVGGPGKGHLVREVVALGGLMGRVTDRSGLQFRTLNRRKGPAVRATRVQTDSALYAAAMAEEIRGQPGGTVIEDRAVELSWVGSPPKRRVAGVRLSGGRVLGARAVVLAMGTFLRGELFVGRERSAGGRRGALPAVRLALCLERAGLPLLRLKTGTCPRLDGATVGWSGLDRQTGDEPPPFFDPATERPLLPQLACYVTYTGEKSHEIVRRNLASSALYSGAIQGVGPRYCPSFETKVAKFPEKDRHQIFLEPEDRDARVIYPAGLSTSLPAEVQEEMVHAIPGLERARIVRFGYAVEYDAVQPRGLRPSLEVDGFSGLFLAGQILGTSGYEEAAALGLVAGANAALVASGQVPLVFGRDQAYIGVMVDDLTTRGVDEPYRMFTSRAEYRLLLREDNADERLLAAGRRTGLVQGDAARAVERKIAAIQLARERLAGVVLTPSAETNQRLADAGLPTIAKPFSLFDLARRADVPLLDLRPFAPWLDELPAAVRSRLEVDAKYQGYLGRQALAVERLHGMDAILLPRNLDFASIPGLRPEIAEKLEAVRPSTLGQASRIPGITPAALQVLHVWCGRSGGAKHNNGRGG